MIMEIFLEKAPAEKRINYLLPLYKERLVEFKRDNLMDCIYTLRPQRNIWKRETMFTIRCFHGNSEKLQNDLMEGCSR